VRSGAQYENEALQPKVQPATQTTRLSSSSVLDSLENNSVAEKEKTHKNRAVICAVVQIAHIKFDAGNEQEFSSTTRRDTLSRKLLIS
jgi:hypothetical protein